MSSRAAEFASAILIGVLVGVFAGAYLIIMPYGEADDCLSQPKGDTQAGQHWFYRIDRGTKRHCWYLKDQGEKVARAATREASDSKTASRKTDTKTDTGAQHSVSDAHAELRSRARIEDNTSAARPTVVANAVANNTVTDDNGANVMTRWPEPAGVSSSANAAPQEPPPVVVADNTQAGPAAADPATTAPMTTAPTTTAPTTSALMTNDATADTAAPVATNAPAEKYSGSLQELMVVAFAALALAGLSGSAVYRLARLRFARRRYNASRRSADWQPSKKKSRKARAAANANARPVAVRAEKAAPSSNHVVEPNFAPQPEYAPQPQYAAQPQAAQPQYAPRPEYAPQTHAPRPEYAPRPNFDPQHNVAVLSEYAPKPRPAMRTTRELEDSFESIEELLMRLAK
jgi:hypothetical protein